MIWDPERIHTWPSHLYWPVGSEGLLARCFHLHPLLIRPVRDVYPSGTIDGDYLSHAFSDPAGGLVLTDSEELCCIEVSASSHRAGESRPGRGGPAAVAAWARDYTRPLHWSFLDHRIRFRATEDRGNWDEVERESDRAVETIRFLLDGLAVHAERATPFSATRG